MSVVERKELPQTVFVENYKVVQTSNYHVTIYNTKTCRRVFHCQCDKKLDDKSLKDMVNFYKSIISQR